MSKYLYGASVQGIQEFIFATNKLQEIVGASEIVKSVANEFEKISGYKNNDSRILLNAAGNIKAVFDTRQSCEKVVLEFEKMVQQKAYGITISQAVVKFDGDVKNFINELEKRLKTQRNKPTLPLDISINLMKLNPSTAKPLININSDKATFSKLEAYKSIENKENTNLQKLSNEKNKIAVIHVDGNNLGQLIPNLNMPLSEFSQKLDSATKEAFKIAKGAKKLREVILGGDDVTVICNANDALSFTKEFLYNFEEETKKILGKDKKLTACAGIAYSNEKYPFHYAVNLAETLCAAAKKHSKNINKELSPSSLMFHNIQSSNFQSWDKFVKDELTIKNEQKTIRCDFGPYYLNEPNQALIDKLQVVANSYKCNGNPMARLRNWMSQLYKSNTMAINLLQRINEVTEQSGKWNKTIMDENLKNLYSNLSSEKLIISKDGLEKTPIYDIHQLHSVTDNQGVI
ncbi:MAG: hypothetical protein WC141_05105 [Arcobacteraceae bacterium]